jgi:hypothetical protein
VFVCLLVYLTYSGLIPQAMLVAHLPADAVDSGPWQAFHSTLHDQGLGGVGYNHAYGGAQIIMLLALSLGLNRRRGLPVSLFLIVFSMGAVALTGSRSGLLAILLFSVAYIARRHVVSLVIGAIALVAIVIAPSAIDPSAPSSTNGTLPSGEAQETSNVFERQRTAFTFSDESNLSGRDSIWKDKVSLLNADPIRWITGWGFGASGDHGFGLTAHMLPLQFIVELGLIGFALIASAFIALMFALYRYELPPQPLLIATGALLLSSFSQETFYPVASLGHFLGLFLVGVTLTLRSGEVARIASRRNGASM